MYRPGCPRGGGQHGEQGDEHDRDEVDGVWTTSAGVDVAPVVDPAAASGGDRQQDRCRHDEHRYSDASTHGAKGMALVPVFSETRTTQPATARLIARLRSLTPGPEIGVPQVWSLVVASRDLAVSTWSQVDTHVATNRSRVTLAGVLP